MRAPTSRSSRGASSWSLWDSGVTGGAMARRTPADTAMPAPDNGHSVAPSNLPRFLSAVCLLGLCTKDVAVPCLRIVIDKGGYLPLKQTGAEWRVKGERKGKQARRW